MKYESEAQDISDDLPDDVDVAVDEINDRLENSIDNYDIPREEAIRSVRNNLSERSDASGEQDYEDEDVSISDIGQSHDEEWLNVEVVVEDIWEHENEKVGRKGVVGDESGTCLFTIWQESLDKNPDLLLEKGKSYRLKSVKGDYYEGEGSISLNASTDVEQLGRDIETPDHEFDKIGPVVNIQSGSGLVKRCPEDGCTRVLKQGRCSEHGDRDGEFDLRIKANLDDGYETHSLVFGAEATEELVGLSIEDAIELSRENLGKDVVNDVIEGNVLGRIFHVLGTPIGQNVVVDSAEQPDIDVSERAAALLDEFGGEQTEVEA
jgi:replication factor A1